MDRLSEREGVEYGAITYRRLFICRLRIQF